VSGGVRQRGRWSREDELGDRGGGREVRDRARARRKMRGVARV
jgi:hypothetical protein